MKKTCIILSLALLAALTLCGCGKKEEPPKPKEVPADQLKEQAGKLTGHCQRLPAAAKR